MINSAKLTKRVLEDALMLIASGQELVRHLHADKTFIPDAYDFTLLQRICERCDQMRLISLQTGISLQQRLKGEPESPLPVL